jgi:hypothetical protein
MLGLLRPAVKKHGHPTWQAVEPLVSATLGAAVYMFHGPY